MERAHPKRIASWITSVNATSYMCDCESEAEASCQNFGPARTMECASYWFDKQSGNYTIAFLSYQTIPYNQFNSYPSPALKADVLTDEIRLPFYRNSLGEKRSRKLRAARRSGITATKDVPVSSMTLSLTHPI